MRKLIRDLPYERLIAAGRHRYDLDGRPTGVVEHWQLTSAVDDYRFLRVDRDDREGATGETALYHLTVDPGGRLERLAFRIWGPLRRIDGNLLSDGQSASLSFTSGEESAAGSLTLPDPSSFLFPAALGHYLLCATGPGPLTLVELALGSAPGLRPSPAEIADGAVESREIAGAERTGRPRHLSIGNARRTLWTDGAGIPLVVDWVGGPTAVADRYIHHQAT